MCQEASAAGTLSGPDRISVRTGIEPCQRSGVFVNSTDQPMTVISAGVPFLVPPRQAATVPVGFDLLLDIPGDGVAAWMTTSSVLPAQIIDAPALEGGPPGDLARTLNTGLQGRRLRFSSGSYTKLIFAPVEREKYEET